MSLPSRTFADPGVRNYAVVTLAYWADTLADGAIRTLVLFYFSQQGYSALQVALLFLFYEVFGIITNFCGGYLGARFGLKSTLFLGLGTQIVALGVLAWTPAEALTVTVVMVSQAFSGIAKDLTKMSSKSAVKLVAGESQGRLYRWVALLTGSKNALKGVGFFLGGLMLSTLGFQTAAASLAGLVALALLGAALLMRGGPTKRRSSATCFPKTEPSTSWPWPGFSFSAPGTFGLWWRFPCFSRPCWDGSFGRRADSWPRG